MISVSVYVCLCQTDSGAAVKGDGRRPARQILHGNVQATVRIPFGLRNSGVSAAIDAEYVTDRFIRKDVGLVLLLLNPHVAIFCLLLTYFFAFFLLFNFSFFLFCYFLMLYC